MKHGRKPTRAQKDKMKSLPAPKNWLVERDVPGCFRVIHRVTKEVRRLGA